MVGEETFQSEAPYLTSLLEGKSYNNILDNNYYNPDVSYIEYGEDYDIVTYNDEYYAIVYDTTDPENWVFQEVKDISTMSDFQLVHLYFVVNYYDTLPAAFDDDPKTIPDASTTLIPVSSESNGAGGIIHCKYKGQNGTAYKMTFGRDSKYLSLDE